VPKGRARSMGPCVRRDDVGGRTFQIATALPSRRPSARVLQSSCPQKRARGMRGRRLRPQPCVRNEKAHKRSHCGHTGNPGIPRANGFTVYFVVSPETGLYCLRHPREALASQELTPASGCQDATTSPSAPVSFVTNTFAAIASRTHVRDDRETPLLVARDDVTCAADFRKGSTTVACDRLTRRANQSFVPKQSGAQSQDLKLKITVP